MGAPQTIRTEAGDELVVLSRRDYDSLLARTGDPEAEDRMSEHILAAAHAAALVSTVQPLPAGIWEKLEAQDNGQLGRRLKVLREARGLKRHQLSQAADLAQSLVDGIEDGAEPGSPATLQRLAQVLAVEYETLVGVGVDAA